MENEIRRKLIRLLTEIGGAEAETILLDNPDAELFESGILDSLAFAELFAALYDAFGVELQPTELPRESISTLSGLEHVIRDSLRTEKRT